MSMDLRLAYAASYFVIFAALSWGATEMLLWLPALGEVRYGFVALLAVVKLMTAVVIALGAAAAVIVPGCFVCGLFEEKTWIRKASEGK